MQYVVEYFSSKQVWEICYESNSLNKVINEFRSRVLNDCDTSFRVTAQAIS